MLEVGIAIEVRIEIEIGKELLPFSSLSLACRGSSHEEITRWAEEVSPNECSCH